MPRTPEFPRQVGYQIICPQGTDGCAVRTIEVRTNEFKHTVERLPDCNGAVCSPDQSVQVCGRAAPAESKVQSVCPRLTPGNCAILMWTEGDYQESLLLRRPGCPGGQQAAEVPQPRQDGARVPRIGAFVCGLDVPRPHLRSV